MPFRQKLALRIAATGSNLCVGLDVRAKAADETTKRWIIQVIEETAAYAAAFKPNSAYFEALGWQGMRMLQQVLKEIPKDIPIIFDVKRGDIGETQAYNAKACFEEFDVDAVTLNPYMGRDTLEPFLKYKDKGLYLLGVTSNPGAVDIELKNGTKDTFRIGKPPGHPSRELSWQDLEQKFYDCAAQAKIREQNSALAIQALKSLELQLDISKVVTLLLK